MTDRGGEASHAIDVRSGYLALLPRRDVIERPIDGVFNFNGWDVGKALRLMLKGNAVLFEWLESPIYYHSEPPVVAALRSLADRVLDADNLRSHYPRVAEGQWLRWIAGRETVPRKKYLYALRPALVLWHLRRDLYR